MYGGVNSIIDKILVKLGLEVTYIKGNSIEDYKKAIRPNTKVRAGEIINATVYNVVDTNCMVHVCES